MSPGDSGRGEIAAIGGELQIGGPRGGGGGGEGGGGWGGGGGGGGGSSRRTLST